MFSDFVVRLVAIAVSFVPAFAVRLSDAMYRFREHKRFSMFEIAQIATYLWFDMLLRTTLWATGIGFMMSQSWMDVEIYMWTFLSHLVLGKVARIVLGHSKVREII